MAAEHLRPRAAEERSVAVEHPELQVRPGLSTDRDDIVG